jgi:competence protein ComEA
MNLLAAPVFAGLLALPSLAADLPDGPGKEIILKACDGCHRATEIPGYQHTKDEWGAIVDRMVKRGAPVAGPELETVVSYLARSFPKVEDPAKVNVNKANAKEIEAGLGLTAEEAAAVVEYRDRHGNFRAWGDMLVIYGVNGKRIQAAKDRMSF